MLLKIQRVARAQGIWALAVRAKRRLEAHARQFISAWQSSAAARLSLRLPRKIVPVAFPAVMDPLFSIVVPVRDRRRYTNACLLALARNWDASIATEVITVDDGSTDDTRELIGRCTNVRVVRLERNGGFAAACNAGARIARGKYVHFLNSDAIVARGWLRPLLETFESDATVAAVASQLRPPSGRVAEAGSVIWQDGRGSHYGEGLKPSDERVAYARDVDYASAASLAVRADAFRRVGGFSEEFSPAYYEDVDLCFSLRKRGGRIVYQPRSVVVHIGGVSFGSNASPAVKALQEQHRAIFARKWRVELARHSPADPLLIEPVARRFCGDETIVMIDEHVPFFDRSGGDQRIVEATRILKRSGHHVIFGSLTRDKHERYAALLRNEGIELAFGFGPRAFGRLRRMRLPVTAVWVSRPHIARRLLAAARRAFPRAQIIFDTVDLHYVRLQREEVALGRRTGWQRMRERELALARAADVTVTTSETDRDILRDEGVTSTVVPIIQPAVVPSTRPWEEREGVVFLGNYGHAPNVDAALWLCSEIMPLVRRRLPSVHLTLAGADPPRRLLTLHDERVSVPGFVRDLDELFERQRVFVAPLRFGAGMKAKVVCAMARGLPVVATPIGAEGIFGNGDGGLVADGAEALADAIVSIHEDRAQWENFAVRAPMVVRAFSPECVEPLLRDLISRAGHLREQHAVGMGFGASTDTTKEITKSREDAG